MMKIMKYDAKICKIMLIMAVWCGICCSCKKPFSINADYEDIPIVYAVFNSEDSVHYIKVYKSFLTEDNVKEAARDWHNISYADSIEVYVEEYNSHTDKLLRTVRFDTTTAIAKDSGLFAYPYQILYRGNMSMHVGNYYKLKIYNSYTQKMVEGEVLPVDSVALLYPKRNVNPPTLLSLPYTSDIYMNFTAAANAYMYSVKVLYYYSEQMRDSLVLGGNVVEWDFGSVDGTGVAKTYSTGYYKSDMFFRTIANKIKDNPQVAKRYTDSLVIQVEAMNESVYKYALAHKPSSGINQEQGNYTNLTAYDVNTNTKKMVLGIVGTKSVTKFHYDDLATPGTRDSLVYGQHTKHLRFSYTH